MELRPEEITKIIKSQIKNYENHIVQEEVGTVLVVGDGIARASGLEKCMMNELLEFPNGEYGIVQNLEENTVAVIIWAMTAASRKAIPSAAPAVSFRSRWAKPSSAVSSMPSVRPSMAKARWKPPAMPRWKAPRPASSSVSPLPCRFRPVSRPSTA